ncbi:MAG: cytochrome C biogenesis protein CcmC [Hyphococcus sp.]|nr:MAG: cytochrome C biogenesis protein CcmC [Marinicaulis sp.]
MAFFYDLANPVRFERITRYIFPAVLGFALVTGAAGVYFALFNSPADYQQGDSVRIMYVHVPAAWMALFCYSLMAFASAVGFIWKHPLADVAAKETAPIGAGFTFLALFTGALWGKPMWGAWWVWDARLTSVLVLMFLYLGYMALWRAVSDKSRAARLAAILAIVGFINVPVIKFSVDWWNSLHQPASVFKAGGPSIDGAMLIPLFLMIAAYMFGFTAMLLQSMKNELLERRLSRLERVEEERTAKLVEL